MRIKTLSLRRLFCQLKYFSNAHSNYRFLQTPLLLCDFYVISRLLFHPRQQLLFARRHVQHKIIFRKSGLPDISFNGPISLPPLVLVDKYTPISSAILPIFYLFLVGNSPWGNNHIPRRMWDRVDRDLHAALLDDSTPLNLRNSPHSKLCSG